jgi:hypothetical protein
VEQNGTLWNTQKGTLSLADRRPMQQNATLCNRENPFAPRNRLMRLCSANNLPDRLHFIVSFHFTGFFSRCVCEMNEKKRQPTGLPPDHKRMFATGRGFG